MMKIKEIMTMGFEQTSDGQRQVSIRSIVSHAEILKEFISSDEDHSVVVIADENLSADLGIDERLSLNVS
jgi:hypothetical protein